MDTLIKLLFIAGGIFIIGHIRWLWIVKKDREEILRTFKKDIGMK